MRQHIKAVATSVGAVAGAGWWVPCFLLCAGCVRADELAGTTNAPPDKAGYSLFHPTPEALLRDFNPDRPDATESPFTVDAGHYQLEMDFFNFTHAQSGGVTTKQWNVGDFNLRVGLLNQLDLQLIYDNYLNLSSRDAAGRTGFQSGFGDLTTRLKFNLWGDDGGTTAFALLPYLKFPASTGGLGNGSYEGGLILPLAVNLPHDFDLGLETGGSVMRNHADSGYHEEFVVSASVDHPIIGNLSGYVEFFSNFTTEQHAGWVGTVDTGLEYQVTKNFELDCSCFFGVTSAAPDYNPFAGFTVRF